MTVFLQCTWSIFPIQHLSRPSNFGFDFWRKIVIGHLKISYIIKCCSISYRSFTKLNENFRERTLLCYLAKSTNELAYFILDNEILVRNRKIYKWIGNLNLYILPLYHKRDANLNQSECHLIFAVIQIQNVN